jgi:hypothetical protein
VVLKQEPDQSMDVVHGYLSRYQPLAASLQVGPHPLSQVGARRSGAICWLHFGGAALWLHWLVAQFARSTPCNTSKPQHSRPLEVPPSSVFLITAFGPFA